MVDRGMWRYNAIATAIVVVLGAIAFGHRLVTGGTIRADRTTTRRSNPGTANGGYVTTPPECFTQRSSVEGPSRLVASHVPSRRLRIAPGTTLKRADCTVLVRANDIW